LKFRFWRRRSSGRSRPERAAFDPPVTDEQMGRIFKRCRDLHMEILDVAAEVCKEHGFTPERFVAVAYIVRSHAFRAFEENWMEAFKVILGKLMEELGKLEVER